MIKYELDKIRSKEKLSTDAFGQKAAAIFEATSAPQLNMSRHQLVFIGVRNLLVQNGSAEESQLQV